jgi:hypothetical protein
MNINIGYQDQFGCWHRLQGKHNAADAYRTVNEPARCTGKRHRLLDSNGHLLDLIVA